MSGQLKTIVVSMICVLLLPVHAIAQPCGGYEVTAIVSMEKCPPFGVPPVVPVSLNEQGWMVGYFNPCIIGASRAWVWTPDDGLLVIPTPNGTSYSLAVAISGSLIVGEYDNSELELGRTGFLYNYETDQFTSLGTLPGGNWSGARDINSAGLIAGFWGNNLTGPWQAFLWENGKMIDLGPSVGGTDNRALGINETGAITGWWQKEENGDRIAFLWEDGKVTSLGPIPGGFTSEGLAINDRLDMVGRGRFFDPKLNTIVWRAFAYVEGEAFQLDPLPGSSHSSAQDINNAQTVVGASNSRAFIWEDGLLTNLNDLVPTNFNMIFKSARSINENGQIAALAVNADNDNVAVLLSPIEGPLGDLDNDCQVSVVDLLLLFSNWGPCDSCAMCPADLDENCTVSVSDLLILFANWG